MNCPNCHHHLKTMEFDNQEVLHCSNCGGSYFFHNGINRISVSSARALAGNKKADIISGEEKHCPRDNDLLVPLFNEEVIPQGVTLLQCNTCQGVFAYPEDLLIFKKAQKVKLDYYKLWNKPLPSLRQVLLFSFIAFMAVALSVSLFSLNRPRTTQTSADEYIGVPYSTGVTRDGKEQTYITFTTDVPYRADVIFYDRTAKTTVRLSMNSMSTTTHSLVTDEIDRTHTVDYVIVLTGSDGKEILSTERRLK